LNIYLVVLFTSGIIPVISGFLFFKNKKDRRVFILTAWFLLRFITDITTTFLKIKFNICVFPFYHFSIFIESILIIHLFNSLTSSKWRLKQLIYFLPIVSLFLETVIFSSLFEANRYGFILYNILVVFLVMWLYVYEKKPDKFIDPILKMFLVFHAVSLFYSFFEHIIRNDINLMSLVYPVFLMLIMSLNLYFGIYLWLMRKK
jgi:hypothetical protein